MPKVKSDTSLVRSVAVIGSGLTGLVSAILMARQGHQVRVFEKSRGPGGRLSSKRVGNGDSADIGAQYFTIRDPRFRLFLQQWAGENSFAPWPGRFGYQHTDQSWQSFPNEARYVGIPRMSAISRALSEHVAIKAGIRIARLVRDNSQWQLFCSEGEDHGHYDQVIITAPPAQAQQILEDSGQTLLADKIDYSAGQMLPCWAVAVRLDGSVPLGYDGMRPNSDALFWLANNASKPGREQGGQWWVLHATPEWTNHHLETPIDLVEQRLLGAFRDLTGYEGEVAESIAHRWLYARSLDGARPGYLLDAEQGLSLAGDWLAGGRVEGAWESADRLVAAINAE